MVHLNSIEKDYVLFNKAYDVWIAGEDAPACEGVEAKMYTDDCFVELTIVGVE